jgi:hypothetical protein
MTAIARTRALAAAIGLVLAAALVGLASLPTGAASADAVAPPSSRVAGRVALGDARVLLLSDAGRLRIAVAYRDDKGWFRVEGTRPPDDAAVAWTATRGGGPVPALSSVYGRVEGATVEVRWADGRVSRTVPATGGTFVVARRGHVRSQALLVRDTNGDVIDTVEGP